MSEPAGLAGGWEATQVSANLEMAIRRPHWQQYTLINRNVVVAASPVTSRARRHVWSQRIAGILAKPRRAGPARRPTRQSAAADRVE